MNAPPAEHAKIHRTHWSQDEVEKLKEGMRARLATNPRVPFLDALDHAQRAMLPPERWRRLKYQNTSFMDTRKVRALQAVWKEARTLAATPAVELLAAQNGAAPAPEPAQPATPATPAVQLPLEPLAQIATAPAATALDLHTTGTAALVAELLARLGNDVVARLDRIECALLDRIRPSAPEPAKPATPAQLGQPAPRVRHPVLAIVGLLRDQFEHVRQRVSHLPFSLLWLDKEASRPAVPASVEYAVIQHHVGHGWDTAVRAALPNGRVVFSDGGISTTVQRIMDLHSRHVAEASR